MKNRKKVLVCGAGGFIGNHLVSKLKEENCWVRAVDLVYPAYNETCADEFYRGDLRDQNFCKIVFDMIGGFDEVYQLAADMGGAGYIFTGLHDADVMHNSAQINLNTAVHCVKTKVKKVFFSSSACIYPAYNQEDPDNPKCSEDSAYPANPDSEYGWEKLFSERLYFSYLRNYGLNVKVGRFHNIFGPKGSWNNGKEKAPAAVCRKVAEARDGGVIEIWGDGSQTRSFMYIDECLRCVEAVMKSDFSGPVNIGSEEMISINNLAKLVMDVAGKNLTIENIPGPTGVRGRNSDNNIFAEKMGWRPEKSLRDGIEKTYSWVELQVHSNNEDVYQLA